MEIFIIYKNGTTVTHKINYLHCQNGFICFTIDRNPHPIFQEPVKIPLENIDTFEVNN